MRRLVAVWFDGSGDDRWARMARVLEHTARRHCPGWSVEVRRIDPPKRTGRTTTYEDNTAKLDEWAATVLSARDGDELLLMDVDAMILGPLDGAWAGPLDFAYTVRDSPKAQFPINAGVVFARISPEIKGFFLAWSEENRKMLARPGHHREWQKRYGGINQSALGLLIEQRKLGAELGLVGRELPCSEWNSEESTWERYQPGVTKIVHIKGQLRRIVLGLSRGTDIRIHHLARLWRQLEREAA